MLELLLMGPPVVRVAGAEVRFRTSKALALLAVLALEGRQTREALGDLLWHEDTPDPRAEVRGALHHLRLALGPEAARLGTTPRDVWLDLAGADVDLAVLDSGEAGPGALLKVWRGPLLAGLSVLRAPRWDDWVGARAQEYADRFGALLARGARAQLAGGEVAAAVSAARHWVERDPLNEEAYRLLARAQRAAGLDAAALETERRCRETLRRELGADPLPEVAAPEARPRPRPGEGPAAELPHFLVGGPLIGRQAEFGRLARVYGLAAGGSPQAALLCGEPGIGKTRLAGELLAWARDRGAPLLRGRSPETVGPPFAALVGALAPEQGRLRARLGRAHLEDLARLLPGVLDTPAPPGAGDPRARLPEALSAAVLALRPAAGEATVLLLDDLHWADPSTLDAGLHLAARLAETPAPLLLLLTARSEYLGTGSALSGWLGRVRRHLPLHEERLGPLGAGGTRHLLGTALPRAPGALMDRLAAWLFGETGGHPLYLTETLKGLIESGAVTLGPQGWRLDEARLPGRVEGVRAAIGERLSRLSPAALALAQAAAVLGRGAAFGVLRAVADLEEGEALGGYEELLGTGLLLELPGEEGETPAALSHDRVRETLEGTLSGPRCRALHRRALGALEARGAPPAVLAEHAARGGLGSEAAALFERASHTAAAVGAYDEAGLALERALGLVPLRPDQQDTRLRLLVLLSRRIFARDAGLSPALLERLRGAARAAEAAGVPGEQAAALNLLGAELLHTGRLDEAETCARAALLAARAAGRPRDEVQARLGLARVETARWRWPEARRHGERALHLAGSLGPDQEDLVLSSALTLAVLQRWAEGALRPARERLRALLSRARAFEERVPARLPDQDNVMRRVLWELIWQDLLVGAYGEALDHLAELERAGGRPPEVTLAMRGLIHLRRGDLPGALAATDAALDASERFHLKFPNVYGIRALCLLRAGRPDEARRMLGAGQAASAHYNHVRDRADSALRFGDVLLALGDPGGAEREYRWVLGTFSLPHVLGALRGIGEVWARRGEGPGAALCLGAVLAHGAAGMDEEERAAAILADLRARLPGDILEAALAEGAAAPLVQVVHRVRSGERWQTPTVARGQEQA